MHPVYKYIMGGRGGRARSFLQQKVVSGSEFRDSGFRFRVSGFEFWAPGFGNADRRSGDRVALGILVAGLHVGLRVGFGVWGLGFEVRSSEFGGFGFRVPCSVLQVWCFGVSEREGERAVFRGERTCVSAVFEGVDLFGGGRCRGARFWLGLKPEI
jgi:hypothetical protein